ncbi:MAG: methionyl-tRNA formyltransferase, partial [Acutalibacteraceae bacterium]|nr:methionyl-tRNA formyltransferase [Acutalibacteraceae bacterium]
MKIVFMGTPDFAVPCLEALIQDGNTIAAVFTQPDKPKGRGYRLEPPPVKVCAEAHQIPVYQLTTLKDGTALAVLQELAPDMIVVVAYGKILPKDILTLPPYGC